MKSVVITGSTSGIGYGLADALLKLGCSVTISGRYEDKVNQVVEELAAKHDSERILGFTCDVTHYREVQNLWDSAKTRFGQVDIWINNAGVAHSETLFPNYAPEVIQEVIETNIAGTMHGAAVATNGMQEQGFGAIYNLEGLGSDGRVIKGMALYGTTKAAVTYITKAMAKEVKGSTVIVGGLRPGMTVTKLVTAQYEGHPEEWEKVRWIFNILSDRVETVTPWLADKILQNKRNDITFNWLNKRKLITRFMMAPFHKRNVYDHLL